MDLVYIDVKELFGIQAVEKKINIQHHMLNNVFNVLVKEDILKEVA